MATGKNASPSPDAPSPAGERQPSGARQPLDRNQLAVAAIAGLSTILAALIAALATGWLHFGGQARASQPVRIITRLVTPPNRHTQPPSSASPAPQYLADMTGTGNTPQLGSWSMLGKTYAHSIGFASPGCGTTVPSVRYLLPGTYRYFDALVGVDDNADPSDQGPPSTATPVEFIVYGNPGGGAMIKLADETAEWGNPRPIRVQVKGATLLTLSTDGNNPATCLASEAVWGNAQLVP